MATENKFTDDVSPVVQLGVTTEYPHGYAGPAVLWTGRLADLKAGGGKVKLPKGFAPVRYAVRVEKVPDTRYGNDTGLATGDTVSLAVKHQTRGNDGTYSDASSAAFTALSLSGVIHAAVAESGTQGQAGYVAPADATYGLVANGATTSPAAVTDNVSYATITATGTLTGNANIEIFLFLNQVDPRPEQMF